ncbi:MAG: sodium/proline symporter PutP [Gammaproteobacteria bacterium]
MSDSQLIFITFSGYLLLMLGIGFIAWKRTTSMSDYILGGRKLGRWTTAISAGASDMSGWLLLGLPGYAYLAGLEAIWIAVGLFIGTACNWYLVAPRLRVDTEKLHNALTIPEYLEHRFGDGTHRLRLLSALIILLFYFFYTSSGLVAGGKLFEAVFSIPYHWAVIIGAGTILLYTCLGGFLAVSWTDLIQGLLMALALSYVALASLFMLDGFDTLFNSMQIANFELTDAFTNNSGEALGLIGIVSLLGWGLGYFGQPHILIRFMAIQSPLQLPAARRIALVWTLVGLVAALFIGFAGIVLLSEPLVGADSEKVFIKLLPVLMHPLPAGICLAAILAAIMSTADSQLLVASSALAEDIYKSFRKDVSEKALVNLGRSAVLVLTLLATALALQPDNKVLDLVAYAWAGFGATFGPLILLSLYMKELSFRAALVGMITGAGTVLFWNHNTLGTEIFNLYELIPGFLLSFVSIVVTNTLSSK